MTRLNKSNKYNNQKTIDGIKFDSKFEAQRYCELKLLEKADVISDLKLQKKYILIPKTKTERACSYIADFYYIENDCEIVEDTKGYATKEYIVKRKLFKWLMPHIKFVEVRNG